MTGTAARTCGVVLAGGRSRRMGRDKASMPWGGATMLDAVVAALRSRLPQVIVVGAPAPGARMVHDAVPGEGPLRGLEAGLAAAAEDGFGRAFVAATDMPLLTADVVDRLVRHRAVPPPDVVMATVDGRDQPLAAVYRTALAPAAARALAAGERSLHGFLAALTVARVPLAGLDARAVFNVNTPADAEDARARGIL